MHFKMAETIRILILEVTRTATFVAYFVDNLPHFYGLSRVACTLGIFVSFFLSCLLAVQLFPRPLKLTIHKKNMKPEFIVKNIVWFQKIFIHTPWMVTGNSEGEGGLKTQMEISGDGMV